MLGKGQCLRLVRGLSWPPASNLGFQVGWMPGGSWSLTGIWAGGMEDRARPWHSCVELLPKQGCIGWDISAWQHLGGLAGFTDAWSSPGAGTHGVWEKYHCVDTLLGS